MFYFVVKIENDVPMDGFVTMYCNEINEKYQGDITNGKRTGKGILYKKGKEYLVEYNENGIEKSQKKTSDGTRLMIIGNSFVFFFF